MSPRERSVLQARKLKGCGDLKSILTSHTKMQSLQFSQHVFSLALFQHFFTYDLFPPFQMVIHILWGFMLEVCNLFIDLIV